MSSTTPGGAVRSADPGLARRAGPAPTGTCRYCGRPRNGQEVVYLAGGLRLCRGCRPLPGKARPRVPLASERGTAGDVPFRAKPAPAPAVPGRTGRGAPRAGRPVPLDLLPVRLEEGQAGPPQARQGAHRPRHGGEPEVARSRGLDDPRGGRGGGAPEGAPRRGLRPRRRRRCGRDRPGPLHRPDHRGGGGLGPGCRRSLRHLHRGQPQRDRAAPLPLRPAPGGGQAPARPRRRAPHRGLRRCPVPHGDREAPAGTPPPSSSAATRWPPGTPRRSPRPPWPPPPPPPRQEKGEGVGWRCSATRRSCVWPERPGTGRSSAGCGPGITGGTRTTRAPATPPCWGCWSSTPRIPPSSSA